MRVFVTGARGFVGGHLTRRLAEQGCDVFAHDRELDVSRHAVVADAVAATRPDAIVHLAAISFVPDAVRDPLLAFRVNYLGAHAVLEAARVHAPRARVLLVGSGATYGSRAPGAPPFDELAPLRPDNPYSRTKAAADLLGAAYAARGLDVVRVRPFNHTGVGRPDTFVESSLARQLAEMEAGLRPPELSVGNLDSERDFLAVEDVVDAYWRLLDRGVPAGVYNVASGRATRVQALLDQLIAVSAVDPAVTVDPARVRPPDASVGNASRLAAATGWRPQTSLDRTLGALLEHWRGVSREQATRA